MQLVIFDLDGTLTRTTGVDEACYVRAVRDEFGISAIDNNWLSYVHSTDSGITLEIFQKRFGRPPFPEEVERFKRRFVALLAEAVAARPESCAAVEGAKAALERLTAHPRWAVALATGSWRASAVLKLHAANLDGLDVPSAFADDGISREDIVTLARVRAGERYGCDHFRRVVCVGDAPWDVRAARRLNLPFLGVASGRRARLLREAGAADVVEDFTDCDAVLGRLEKAAVPG